MAGQHSVVLSCDFCGKDLGASEVTDRRNIYRPMITWRDVAKHSPDTPVIYKDQPHPQHADFCDEKCLSQYAARMQAQPEPELLEHSEVEAPKADVMPDLTHEEQAAKIAAETAAARAEHAKRAKKAEKESASS